MKNVLLVGQFTDISGYGNAVRSYFRNLKNLHDASKINLSVLNYSFEGKSDISEEEKEEIRKFSLTNDLSILQGRYSEEQNKIWEYIQNEYVLILFLTNDFLTSGEKTESLLMRNGAINFKTLIKKSSKVLPCVVWETDKPPTSWIQGYKHPKVNHLVCACEWNSEVFSKHSGVKSSVVPYCLKDTNETDIKMFGKIKSITNEKFTFCSVGQWGDRKGFDLLLRAFYTEFYEDEVFLLLKTYANRAFIGKDEAAYLNKEITKIKHSINHYGKNFNPKCKVVLLTELMDKQKINSIYKSSDCYVTATRGEGFGLPIAEFINIANKPVVAPDKGGHVDFIAPDNYLFACSSEPVRGLNSLYSEVEMNYFEPSVGDLRKKMRIAYNNRDKQCNNREYLLDYLDDKKIEDKFMDIIDE